MRIYARLSAISALSTLCAFAAASAEDSAWVNMFNGKDLAGWTPYFQKTGLKNTDSTFKYSPEGHLFVDIKVDFGTTGFGHLFYTKRKLSYYLVRAVYRFPANSFGPNWGQGWNRENNGLMVHSQDPATMGGKDFPNSIEVQLLGKNNEQNGGLKSQGFKYAATGNMCSPGTLVAYNGSANYTTHCTAAQYPAAWKNTEIPWEDPAGWSDITVRVLADSLVQHFIHGVKVFEYTRLRLDNGTPLKEGYLSVQAEGTSTQFKTLQFLDLVGCMDQTKPGYRTYFVKNDPSACNTTSAKPAAPSAGDYRFLARDGGYVVQGPGALTVEVMSLDGSRLETLRGEGAVRLPAAHYGLRLVRVTGAAGSRVAKLALP